MKAHPAPRNGLVVRRQEKGGRAYGRVGNRRPGGHTYRAEGALKNHAHIFL